MKILGNIKNIEQKFGKKKTKIYENYINMKKKTQKW